MQDANDMELVREFARNHSEGAFTELVRRHLNLVYSVALRRTGNPGDAEDVAQAVFVILARKAAGLSERTILAGWLYQTTRFAAARLARGNIRRQQREQEAYMESTADKPQAEAWAQIAPLLEEAMGRLGETDRNAILLRFFENKTAAEAATALNLSEAAAHKRTSRALEKLRNYFAKCGIRSTTAVLSGAITAQSVHTAPALLAKSVTLAAMANGASASASTLTLIKGALKFMAWQKTRTALIAVAVAAITATVGGGYLVFHHSTRPGQVGKLKLPVGDIAPAIGFGQSYGVVLSSDGSLWSWGENALGWPGLGLGTVQNEPMLTRIGTNNDWTGVAVGLAHTLALKKDGTIWSWGENLYDELGTHPAYLRARGRINLASDSAGNPTLAAIGGGWAQVAAGMECSFGIKSDGTLWAWGLNNFGQLGIGNRSNTPAPAQVGVNTWKEVRAGFINGAGIQTDGSLWAWGGGPTAGNTATGNEKAWPAPQRISDDTNWVDAAVGENVVFALNSDGSVWAWGYAAARYTKATGGESTLTRIGTDSDWSGISCCASRWLVLTKKDGSLWTMTSTNDSDPAELKPVHLQKDVVAIGGGRKLAVALTRDGEMWTWGRTIGEGVTTFRKSGKNIEEVPAKSHVYEEPWQLANNGQAP
jgi:RNA polymerase sigma factor (sigma-70 family)